MIEKSSTRAIVNTVIQYIRSILSVIVSLYSSRLILSELGVNDFGLFSLIFGVVSLLSFIKDSLAQTIQRYLAFYQGKNDFNKLCKIFSNSRIIQLSISLLLVIVLFLFKGIVINHLLNIDYQRLDVANFVYDCMLMMLFFTMQSAPYFATLISHENILFTSIIQFLEVSIKLFIAISLAFVDFDKLSFYALCMSLVPMLSFIFYWWYAKTKYKEVSESQLFSFDISLFKEMFSFMGWNIYSVGCIVGRTQGVAIVLNRFFGVVVNASYGIAQQVTGQVSFLSSSILNAMQPQIIRAEGAGDRNKMLCLAETTSKFAFYLIALITVPSLFYMDKILLLWLGEIPEYSVMACQYVLLAAWLDQLTIGLGIANRAIGHIKTYSIVVNTIKLLTVPTSLYLLNIGFDIESVFITFVFFELLCSIVRLFLLKIQAKIAIERYLRNVFLCELKPVILLFVSSWMCFLLIPEKYFIITYLVTSMIFVVSIYFIGLTYPEKIITKNIIKKI